MSENFETIDWRRGEHEGFVDNKFSRLHRWTFDGGITLEASASPHVIRPPYSTEEAVDPEEAFVASLSSCHMLFFLYIAAKSKFVVDQYTDDAVGVMEKGSDGKIAMTKVVLRPRILFAGDMQPTLEQIERIHHESHDQCFIANSVKTEVVIEGVE